MVFGIGYDDDFAKAKDLLKTILTDDDRVHADPEPWVMVTELADSSVNITCRVWANTSDYWGVYFDTIEKAKQTFDAEGISIPYPQTDLHLHHVEA